MSSPRDYISVGYRRIVKLLVYLGIVPGVLLSAIGVLLLVLGEARFNLLMGILVLTFTGTLVTGVILVWVFLRRERDLSELQADFVSKVSHELRTPLTSIRMFTETLALRRGDQEAEDRCIAALTRESSRLQHLIDRLLDWGRMESGRRVYHLENHVVSGIVHEAIEAFQPTRERRDVDLIVEIDPDLPELLCDRSALVDSLVNLLSNAYKYGGTPRRIEVRAARHSSGLRGGSALRITVEDNGPGIARTEHKRIFDKFYRVDDLLAREQQGSGLGLAIVQHVIRAHRGKVEVDSEKGKGSAFSLVLPLDGKPLPAPEGSEAVSDPHAEGGSA
jgi:two-component system, OmpR family, phosphate regulon sensor histidine kinase PhoR